MHRKAFRASFTLSAAGDVRPADAAPGGDLPLGLGDPSVQPVAQAYDLPFPCGQAGVHAFPHLDAGVPGTQLLQHIVVHRDHVHQGQGPVLPAGLQGIGQGHLPLELALGPEVHQNFVLDAPAGVSSQADILIRLEGRDTFNKADGPDGDQIVLVAGLGVIFFDDMGHQPQIVLHQHIPGLQIPLGAALQIHPLLLRLQGPGEGPAAGQAQGEKQAVQNQIDCGR